MKTLILILLTSTIAIAQNNHFGKEPLDNDYGYFTIGSSSAVKPHTNDLILNAIVTAGVRYKIFDISVNAEYVNLDPKYLSYFFTLQVIPITINNFEFGIGFKKGNIIRVDNETYDLLGVNGEVRFTPFKRLFISLVGNYDYRGDIESMWGEDYFIYTTHLKIGIKI